MTPPHEHFLQMAIEQAISAGEMGEVPVGAVIVDGGGRLIARDHNRTISSCDPSAHAEMNVLRTAALKLENYRLLSTTLYVTIEPCIMCMGAIIHSRVARVVFGTFDPKWGAAGSLYNFAEDMRLNHMPEIISGICLDEAKRLMQDFFRNKRKKA